MLKNLKILCALIFFSILVLTVTSDSFALQQVAGKILVNVSPGYTESFQWGLFSESNIVTTVHLSAEGQGSEFLSFPDTFSIEPNQIGYVNISVSVPEDYGGKATLDPILYATEIGKNEEGNVSINLKMKKTVSLVISTQDSLVDNLKNGFASKADIPPPLKQIASGTEPENVICIEGLELVFKSTNGFPACVKPKTAEKLIQRGWAST